MKFISLFAGIGGFDLALTRQGHECVWANEWDKYAAQIYDKNFSNNKKWNEEREMESGTQSSTKKFWGDREQHIDTRDIRTVPTEEIPDHDLLVGGFPCQAFSIAGKRKGFDDTRGTLFFEIARILREKHTRLFILENVKGLLSHDNGNTFKTIISTLDELGYDIQWQVLNSKNFGVPQNRERVFIIGNLRGTSRPEVFPITGNSRQNGEVHTTKGEVAQTINTSIGRNQSDGQYIKVVGTLETDGWEKRFEEIRRIHSPGGIAPTLPTGTGGGVMTKIMKQSKIRRLTPIECERLQGFHDNWTAGVSDTQRYKMCGNAVTVNVVSYLVSKF